MLTVAETDIFKVRSAAIWTQEERIELCAWIAANPMAGDVIRGTGGCRKVRWQRAGTGKRRGARVIYFSSVEDGTIWLLSKYRTALRGILRAHVMEDST